MSDGTHPTPEQQAWLAGVLGRKAWRELSANPDFITALNTSMDLARRIGLKHIASKEGSSRPPKAEAWAVLP